jgi:hypothetical protein
MPLFALSKPLKEAWTIPVLSKMKVQGRRFKDLK